jgi:hypothetical protein
LNEGESRFKKCSSGIFSPLCIMKCPSESFPKDFWYGKLLMITWKIINNFSTKKPFLRQMTWKKTKKMTCLLESFQTAKDEIIHFMQNYLTKKNYWNEKINTQKIILQLIRGRYFILSVTNEFQLRQIQFIISSETISFFAYATGFICFIVILNIHLVSLIEKNLMRW